MLFWEDVDFGFVWIVCDMFCDCCYCWIRVFVCLYYVVDDVVGVGSYVVIVGFIFEWVIGVGFGVD